MSHLGRENCVTIESINRAFNKASNEFRLTESRDAAYSEQLAETLLETSRLLALEYIFNLIQHVLLSVRLLFGF